MVEQGCKAKLASWKASLILWFCFIEAVVTKGLPGRWWGCGRGRAGGLGGFAWSSEMCKDREMRNSVAFLGDL